MNKNLITLAIVIALIALGAWLWQSSSDQPSTTATFPTTEDTTTAIDADLSDITVESDTQDFTDIDADIQAL